MLRLLLPLLILASVVGYIGKNRKFGFWGYFFLSILFTPIVGLVTVFASDKRPAPVAPAA